MFYQYFWPLSWFFNIFGITKPLVSRNGEPRRINWWFKMWSIIIALAFIISFIMTNEAIELSLKYNLEKISNCNDLVTNVIIIFINLMNGENTCIVLYETIDKILNRFGVDRKVLKLFAIKMYVWFCTPIIAFIVIIILEVINSNPPFILLIRIPVTLSMLHLLMQLYVILGIVKVINNKLSGALKRYDEINYHKDRQRLRIFTYIIEPDIKFLKINNEHIELKRLCEIYDELNMCNQLLEKHHGLQVLMSIWLMFSCAVAGVTMIVCNLTKIQWLLVVRTVSPFVWIFTGCYIDDHLQKEVDNTNNLIIKCLIDYRCDPIRKFTLEAFKQLVNTNRLQFTACSLFKLNYAMILGTILNVLTYSIILIQLFLGV